MQWLTGGTNEIFFGNTYLIAVFDCSVQGNERFRWIPNNVFFQRIKQQLNND
jgi:hypothetical protein